MKDKQLDVRQLSQGIRLSVFRDPKFKANRLSVHLMMPLNADSASALALLACLLPKACAAYPTLGSFSQRQNELYGAVVDGKVAKLGENLMVTLYAQGVDDRFVPGEEPVTEQLAQLVCDILLAPCVQGDAFEKASFWLEQQYLLDTILSEINDKRVFALRRAQEIMLAGEKSGYPRLGTAKAARALTEQDTYRVYQQMLCQAPILVQLTGTGHLEEAAEVFAKRLSGLQRENLYQPQRTLHRFDGKQKEVVQTQKMNQSKLVLGFAMGNFDNSVPAVRLLNSVISASPNSRFFTNVREKHSLCYYCAASFQRRPGICLVDSGIRAQDRQKTTDAIAKELADVANGGVSDEELAQAKRYLADVFTSVPDSLAGMESWNLGCLMEENATLEQEAAAVEQVTGEQLAQVCGRMQLDTVYFLQGEGNADEPDHD